MGSVPNNHDDDGEETMPATRADTEAPYAEAVAWLEETDSEGVDRSTRVQIADIRHAMPQHPERIDDDPEVARAQIEKIARSDGRLILLDEEADQAEVIIFKDGYITARRTMTAADIAARPRHQSVWEFLHTFRLRPQPFSATTTQTPQTTAARPRGARRRRTSRRSRAGPSDDGEPPGGEPDLGPLPAPLSARVLPVLRRNRARWLEGR